MIEAAGLVAFGFMIGVFVGIAIQRIKTEELRTRILDMSKGG